MKWDSYLFNGDKGYIVEMNYRTRKTISAWYLLRLYNELLEEARKKNNSEENESTIFMPVNPNLLKYLCENPALMYQLAPDVFEDVMAKLYRSFGFDVIKTQATRDGGKDLILIDHSALGTFIYYADCKRHKPGNNVGVDIIRKMSGIVMAERITGGIIATTTFFTKPAKRFIEENNLNNIIKLHDFDYISNLLKRQSYAF